MAAINPTAALISKVFPLGFCRCAGLRLQALRGFQAFLAAIAYTACASSYHHSSTGWQTIRANIAVKRTCLRQAADLVR